MCVCVWVVSSSGPGRTYEGNAAWSRLPDCKLSSSSCISHHVVVVVFVICRCCGSLAVLLFLSEVIFPD